MQPITEKYLKEKGLRIHFIQSKKYKTVNIVAKLKAPLEKETVTKRALLPYILKQGTKNYPSRKDLQLKLDDLYGAVLAVNGGKKGENHLISLRLEIANPKFIPEAQTIIKDGIELFSEILFHPNVRGNAFDEKVFEREKDTLKQKIHAVKDDKMQYANTRLIDEMCKDEPYGLHVHGYEEELARMTSIELYEYYKTRLTEDQLDIYVLGDFNEDEVLTQLKSSFNWEGTGSNVQVSSKQEQSNESHEVIEKDNIGQAKLHIGYRTNVRYKDDDYAALQVFNGLFGGFPSSKLFINVREKNSLAYYASSRMESHKGLLFVFSGIAPSDFEKARDIIREQMTAMKQGDFTDKELNETKDLIINQLLETMDHSQGLIELLYQQVIGEKELAPDDLIAAIKNVTKDQVVQVAQKIKEDTVYLLTSEGGQGNE
ncbi:EF-P 5-aminopentanol modification-associated protein YfmF [Oceanobacillus bengalensis]|uniref:Insulinase family protein n=1 Tax=Oceanobacillus bengalensis TaxID=1435466 RepID=A0A494Z453_9BACI|nr:pitrilysin family protein [Oceanobacillus bengalensis]RKQ17316.1 insulinase family protein [Oceanobacillus bengalensis]